VEGVGVIPDDIEPTALAGPFRSKGAYNDMTSGLYGGSSLTNISQTLGPLRKKVKNCPIVPDFLGMRRQAGLGDVGDHPSNLLRR
jgi:hypothetical protein